MNKLEKLDLQKMIKANDVVDYTEDIRAKKHSQRIRDDVTKMIDLKKKYARLEKRLGRKFSTKTKNQMSTRSFSRKSMRNFATKTLRNPERLQS